MGYATTTGHAVKAYKKIGDVNVFGDVIKEEKAEGYYYLWYRGVHMLGGQESIGLHERCEPNQPFLESEYIDVMSRGDPERFPNEKIK